MDERGNLVVVVVGLLSICCLVDSVPDTTMVYHRCGKNYHVTHFSFTICKKKLLAFLPELTADHGYNWHFASSHGTVSCFGHGACYGGLSREDCISCLQKVPEYIDQEHCDWSEGVQFKLVDCRLRFEKYEFQED